jgi:uncharacterized protein (TIGR03000 family)
MKRLLLGTAAVLLALCLVTSPALADGKGHGGGHGGGNGGGGWHGNGNWSGNWHGSTWHDNDHWNWHWNNGFDPRYGYNPYYSGFGRYSWFDPGFYNSAFAAYPGNGYYYPSLGRGLILSSLLGSPFTGMPLFAPGLVSTGFFSPAFYGSGLSGLAAAPAQALPVGNAPRLQVNLPDPEAIVQIGGQRMTSVGRIRTFELPPVQSGQAETYKVVATWNEGGRIVTDVRKVDVVPGSMAMADFTRPAPAERVSTPIQGDLERVNTPTPP